MSYYYNIQTYAKLQGIIKTFERSDLVNREFTKKEFDKIFKGISSLDWLRKERSFYPEYRIVKPFVQVTRVEDFEMPYKNGKCEKITAVKDSDEETIKDTFTAHRNFYTVDLEALQTCAAGIIISDVDKTYYITKLGKARKKVAELEKIVSALGITI